MQFQALLDLAFFAALQNFMSAISLGERVREGWRKVKRNNKVEVWKENCKFPLLVWAVLTGAFCNTFMKCSVWHNKDHLGWTHPRVILPLLPRLPCRAEQCRVSAAGEGLVCERQLDVGRRAAGGGQHGHRTETGIGDYLASVQARPVHPLEQTLSQGEAKHAHTRQSRGQNRLRRENMWEEYIWLVAPLYAILKYTDNARWAAVGTLPRLGSSESLVQTIQ